MSAADELATEMLQEATNIAEAWLEIFEMQEGHTIQLATEREAFSIGVSAGFIGTMQMLQKRGLLPEDRT